MTAAEDEIPVVRVVLCEDHPVYRQGLALLLEEGGEVAVVGQAGSGEQALDVVAACSPDVVIMDVHLPGISGVEATRRLRQLDDPPAVLVLTMLDDDASVAAALRAGAAGYLLKGADHRQILTALRAVSTGSTYLAAQAGTALRRALSDGPRRRAFDVLTDREEQLLNLVATGASNDSVGRDLSLSSKTVRNMTSTVMAKLGVGSRAELVARARDAGLGTSR
ncbi:MAG: two component transcriptional regulator, LuxR family [Frankiales bacterium]|nr:two component transcriptional regulator, LuxR family [Frankiales bacterium]